MNVFYVDMKVLDTEQLRQRNIADLNSSEIFHSFVQLGRTFTVSARKLSNTLKLQYSTFSHARINLSLAEKCCSEAKEIQGPASLRNSSYSYNRAYLMMFLFIPE